MPSFSAASFEHYLVFEKFGAYGREPPQKLFGIERIVMIEVLPRPTKLFRRRGLVRFNLMRFDKAWNAARHWKTSPATRALELSFDDFALLAFRHRELSDLTFAGRTGKIMKESLFHKRKQPGE